MEAVSRLQVGARRRQRPPARSLLLLPERLVAVAAGLAQLDHGGPHRVLALAGLRRELGRSPRAGPRMPGGTRPASPRSPAAPRSCRASRRSRCPAGTAASRHSRPARSAPGMILGRRRVIGDVALRHGEQRARPRASGSPSGPGAPGRRSASTFWSWPRGQRRPAAPRRPPQRMRDAGKRSDGVGHASLPCLDGPTPAPACGAAARGCKPRVQVAQHACVGLVAAPARRGAAQTGAKPVSGSQTCSSPVPMSNQVPCSVSMPDALRLGDEGEGPQVLERDQHRLALELGLLRRLARRRARPPGHSRGAGCPSSGR